jgi:NAD(P)-dependent dehydrogenase (short-subunit alcohol dehydrogenase family)
VIVFQTDVRKEADIANWISGTVKHFGRVDGAANIAGVIPKSIV